MGGCEPEESQKTQRGSDRNEPARRATAYAMQAREQPCHAGKGAALTFFQLLLLEDGRVLRLEAQEGRVLAGHLGVVLLVDGQLVRTDQSDDLEPACCRHVANRLDAARDVVEVEVQRRREERVRRRDELWGVGGDTRVSRGATARG